MGLLRRLPRSLAALTRSWRWLGGPACAVASLALVSQAIADLGVSRAIPLANLGGALSLLFGVAIAGEALRPRETVGGFVALTGAVAASGGAAPGVRLRVPGHEAVWCVWAAAFGVASLVAVRSGRSAQAASREAAYALAAGLLSGANGAAFKVLLDDVESVRGAFDVLDPAALLAVALHPLALGVAAAELAGQLALSAAYTCGRVSIVTPLRMGASVSASVLAGWALFGEHLDARRLGGAAAIVVGGALVASARRSAGGGRSSAGGADRRLRRIR